MRKITPDNATLLKELVDAFEQCRERNPAIWIGFVSTRLDDALKAAKRKVKIT